ncbi:MAG: ATP-binding cassette domain-containing protein [Comamonadaceae bacterium]|nr:ATP-binding cassette domain-containing protein [Comamonadaceae bacterium]
MQALGGHRPRRSSRASSSACSGPNGAGKTTLISALAGLVRARLRAASRSWATTWSRDYRAGAPRARRGAAGTGVRPVLHRARDAAHPVRLLRHRAATTTGSTRSCITSTSRAKADANMRALSGGMKRRVLVAQALVHKPPVIVLDEPTAGVDVELRQGLWQFIRRAQRATATPSS